MRRKLDEKCREHKGKEEQEKLKVTEVHSELVPSDHEMADLFSEIHKSGTESSILSVIPPYSRVHTQNLAGGFPQSFIRAI